jgi:SAM-dependent methyltransferase
MDRVIANVEQAEAWNGDEGAHWVAHQDRYDAMNAAFTEHLLAAAAIGERESVLDIGCGNGKTTRLAAERASSGRTVGVDLSAPMLERARTIAREDGITNVTFEQGDAQVHPFPPAVFDVVISRFGVMFFGDPVAALANIGRAVRPGGRLAFLCWRDMGENEWLMVPASGALQHVPLPDLGAPGAPGPFSLADRDRINQVLDAAGWTDGVATAVDEPVLLGRDAADTVTFLAGTGIARTLLAEADEETATRALAAVGDALRPYEQPDGLRLRGAAWLVTAVHP